DLDRASLGLRPVHCEAWEGIIFINLAPRPEQTLAESLGQMATGLAGYPFGRMTEQWSFKSVINSNWKLFVAAFVELYHAPVLHERQAEAAEGQKLYDVGFEALHYELFSPHSMVSSWGGMAPPKDLAMVKPMERVLRSGLFGPWDAPGWSMRSRPASIRPVTE